MTKVSLTLNGHTVSVDAPMGERLSRTLRERLSARDVKVGCNAGDCGACTVLLNGDPVCACLVTLGQARGGVLETASRLTQNDPVGRPLAERFAAHGAAQCGICIPGMITSAVALLRKRPSPTEIEVKDALGGVLCRCTGYRKIVSAVRDLPAPSVGTGRLGDAIPRTDGPQKISGDEVFGDDVAPPGTLVVHAIRSPHPHTRFCIGDLSEYKSSPGVAAVLTAQDVPGKNAFGVIPGFIDQPVMADKVARLRGEAVALVVAEPDAVLPSFPITWAPLETLDPVTARAENAPKLHDGHPGNVMCRGRVKRGQVDDALDAAHTVVEGRFTTQTVEHAYIEPEAGYAYMDAEKVVVHACTQAPVMDKEALISILAVPSESVRVVPTATGGGFGSKLDVSVQPLLALAAFKTGKPVRMAFTRSESMQSTTKRHPAEMRVKIGADQQGKIAGIKFEGVFDTGAYSSWGPTVASRVPIHASGPYAVPDYFAEATGVFTNGPVGGAFRGFGVPQASIACESLLDDLADQLGIDALEFRIQNALTNGTPTVCGQVFAQGVGIKECLEALRPAWQEVKAALKNEGQVRQGVGVAAGWYGCGNTSLSNPSTMRAGLTSDGRIVLHQGAADIGQGANTAIAQIFAEALGLPFSQLQLEGGDTDITPDAGKTSASRQTFVSGNAARLAGEALRKRLLERVNAGQDAEISLSGGRVRIKDTTGVHELDPRQVSADNDMYAIEVVETYDPPTVSLDDDGQGEPYAQYGYAAHLVHLSVDTRLGTIKLLRHVAAHDVGRAVNPLLIEGQVHGGVAQGIGMALMEEYIPGRTENLHDYLIPTIGDVPPIETILIEEPDAHGPYGAKGLGEHVLIPTAPAILNAIKHATGVRLTQTPATPSRVRAALREAGLSHP